MELFVQAYTLMKRAFRKHKRQSGERYFEHLLGTMLIVLKELPNPCMDDLIMALLHDVKEDVP